MNELDLETSMKRIEYLQRLNYDLLDSLRNQVDWLFDFCDRKGIKIPLSDLEKLMSLSRTAGGVLDESDDRIRSFKNESSDEKDTEPNTAKHISFFVVGLTVQDHD